MEAQRKKEYFRRTFKIGSSQAITLPSWFVSANKIEEGAMLKIIETQTEITISKISQAQAVTGTVMTDMFESKTDRFKKAVENIEKHIQFDSKNNRSKK